MNIIEVLSDLFIFHGTPEYIRSDNGSEFTANQLREWLKRLEVTPTYIEPESPWENGYCESFNGKMRDEFFNGEIFDTLKEAEVLTQCWSIITILSAPTVPLVIKLRPLNLGWLDSNSIFGIIFPTQVNQRF